MTKKVTRFVASRFSLIFSLGGVQKVTKNSDKIARLGTLGRRGEGRRIEERRGEERRWEENRGEKEEEERGEERGGE